MDVEVTTSSSEEDLVVEPHRIDFEDNDSDTRDNDEEDIDGKTPENLLEENVLSEPENKNANESNEVDSLTKDTPSVEEPDCIDTEDSSERNCHTDSGSNLETITFSSRWSDTLNSPIDSLVFSPSENGSCHGLGLQMAVERNISTTLFLGSVSVFLKSTATLYEQLGVSLVKMAQFVHPEQLPPKTLITDELQSIYEVILSLGSDFRSSAEWYRTSVIKPLKSILSTTGTERDLAVKRYRETKQASIEARKLARANYSGITNATKAAEAEIKEWYSKLEQKEGNQEKNKKIGAAIEVTEKDLPWERSLKHIGKKENVEEATLRLIQKLKLVQSCRIRYIDSVKKENDYVTLSQEKESHALSKTQKAEEDQMNFFIKNILSQVFPETAGSLPTVRTNFTTNDTDRLFVADIEKKSIEILSNLNLFKQQSIPYEPGMGVMDAETLGLPEALGVSRDKIKSSLSARENRIEVTEIIIKLFEEIAGTTSKSSVRLLSQIANQRRKDSSGGSTSESIHGSAIGSIWRTTLSVYEDEAKLISGIAFKISKLEKWLVSAKRILENEIESDDTAWKRVCDAARVELKLELRYKQTKQQVEKVRQRASSRDLPLTQRVSGEPGSPQANRKRIDSSGSVGKTNRPGIGTQTPNRVRAFFKGGETMKKLTENALVQIAQRSMNEVDQKEAKDQLALEDAIAEKKSAELAYASCTEERIEKIDAEDDLGWKELKEIIMKLAESIEALKKVRYTVFQNRISQDIDTSFSLLIGQLKEWSESVEQKIHESEQAPSATLSPESTLSTQLTESEIIDPILKMTETDTEPPKLNLDNELANGQPKGQSMENLEVTSSSGNDIQGDDTSDEDAEKAQTSVKASSDDATNILASTPEKPIVLSRTDSSPSAEKETSPEVEAFVKEFWSEKAKDQKVPTIISIFSCAFRPKERMTVFTRNLNGKLYTTKEAIYFLAADNNFTLRWDKITSIEKEKGFMGSNNESDLVISYRAGNAISSFLLCRLADRDDVVAKLQRLKAESAQSEVSNGPMINDGDEAPVPPDLLLQKMVIVVSRTIKNVTIESIFDKVWADSNESESFYGSWLKEEECFDIELGEWKIAESKDKFTNDWCNEKYDRQRFVTFKFNRTTHLYIGPPVAFVKQKHFIRLEGNDKCVLAISAEFEGIPYADTFAVEMRWIATRKGKNDALIQVGLFVNFKKATMLKSQIKTGTISETKNVHTRLFEAVKRACTNSEEGESDSDEDDEVEQEIETKTFGSNIFATLRQFAASYDVPAFIPSIGMVAMLCVGGYFTLAMLRNSGESKIQGLENEIRELRHEVHALHKSIDAMTILLKDVQQKKIDAQF